MESVGFKEWALVCAAIGDGKQSVLVRKGGIAEGRAGFSFRHREFFLFPTFFHEQAAKVRNARELPSASSEEIAIGVFVKVEALALIAEWEIAAALEPLHILREEVVRERFEYDEAPGVHVALIRGFRLAEPWTFPSLRAYGGCRSWVQLPTVLPELRMEAALSDAAFAAEAERFREITAALPSRSA